MKKIVFCILMAFNIFPDITTNAQNWTVEQRDVWSVVQSYWAAGVSGDPFSFLSYIDESYVGLASESTVPETKVSTARWIYEDLQKNKMILFVISPLAIWVKGDFAFVHYNYVQIDQNNKTLSEHLSEGNLTDILMKKNGRWLLVGDHGGRAPD